jgi:hypothetical protein
MSESNFTATIRSPFSTRLLTSNFASVLTDLRRFFDWSALGDIDLRFSVMLARKANAAEGGTTSAA